MTNSGIILSIVGKGAATVAVLSGVVLARKFSKAPDAEIIAPVSRETGLPPDFWINLSMVLVGVLIALAAHAALVMGNRFFATQSARIELILYPSFAIWWFFPGFAALCLSWEIVLRVWMFFTPVQATAYKEMSTRNFDSTLVLRWLAVLIVLPLGLLSLLALPIHTSLTREFIDQGHFASFRHEILPFAEVEDITRFDGYLLRDGSFQPRAGVLIRFKDGRSWNSADVSTQRTVDPVLLKILANDTGLQILHTHIEPK